LCRKTKKKKPEAKAKTKAKKRHADIVCCFGLCMQTGSNRVGMVAPGRRRKRRKGRKSFQKGHLRRHQIF